jgi:hypothetical protein
MEFTVNLAPTTTLFVVASRFVKILYFHDGEVDDEEDEDDGNNADISVARDCCNDTVADIIISCLDFNNNGNDEPCQ